MARTLGASLLSAVLVAGCGSVATTQPPPVSSPSASPLTSPTAGPSAAGPSAAATPGPTTTAACDQGPITVAEFRAAAPRCYLTTDVSILGWWDARRTDDVAQEADLDQMVRGSMPFGPANSTPEDFVFVDAEAAAPPNGWPDGAHWATVTGRRSATNDRACHREDTLDLTAPPHCPSYLVAT